MRGGQGPGALLVHGTAGSWRNFRQWLPALLPRCDAIIPDLPGFGESPTPQLRASLDAWAKILLELTRALGRPPQALGGLGLGGSVALAYLEAARKPPQREGPSKLILYAPLISPEAVRPAVQRAVHLFRSPLLFPLLQGLLANGALLNWWVQHVVAGPDASQEERNLLADDFRRTDLRVLRELLLDALRRDFRPLLRSADLPTLIVVGEGDPFVDPQRLRELPSLAPSAEVVIQRSVGHGWTSDSVEEQQRLIARFLDNS